MRRNSPPHLIKNKETEENDNEAENLIRLVKESNLPPEQERKQLILQLS